MRTKALHIFRIALGVLMSLLLVLVILTRIFSIAGVSESIGWAPFAFLEVESGSMEPKLHKNDLIFVKEVPYEQIEAGDIITYIDGDNLVTHELVIKEIDSFVTKGLANEVQDISVNRYAYVAKYVFRIPYGVLFTDIFAYLDTAVLWVLLAIVLFFGLPVIDLFLYKVSDKKVERERYWVLRSLGCALMISLVFSAPAVTEAKYYAKINDYTEAVALPAYFRANYLSAGAGNTYYIQGWDPTSARNIGLNILNYDNELLYNKKGNDEIYQISIQKILDDDSDGSVFLPLESYNVQIQSTLEKNKIPSADQSSDWIWPDIPEVTGAADTSVEAFGPYLITGSDAEKITDNKNLLISRNADSTYDELFAVGNKKIHFRVYAYTLTNRRYSYMLLGDFVFQTSAGGSFLESAQLSSTPGNLLVNYDIKTTRAGGGSASKNVIITWDNDRVYINENDPVVFDVMQAQKDQVTVTNPRYFAGDGTNGTVAGTNYGELTLQLGAYSLVQLQFFKRTVDTDVFNKPEGTANPAITVRVEEIGSGS